MTREVRETRNSAEVQNGLQQLGPSQRLGDHFVGPVLQELRDLLRMHIACNA